MVSSGDRPSAVCSRPYTIHGWRPSSAVSQPAMLAMNGNGVARSSSHSAQRLSQSFRRQRRKAPTSMITGKMVPSPTMMW